jgi:DNA-binding transcriptional LysR family regulator
MSGVSAGGDDAALLAVDEMSQDAVADGRLVRPFEVTATNGNDYWFISSAARRMPRKVMLFRDWAMAEIRHPAPGGHPA